jgi:hypothetical protein
MTAATAPITMLLGLPASPAPAAPDERLATDAWRCGVNLADGCGVTGDHCEEIVPELIVELI